MPRNISEMVSSMQLSPSSRCIKYLMFIFNLLFVITGIILLSIGATIHAVFRSHQHFLDNKFLSAPNLLIAIGAIIFFIAFFGCCGAVRENYCMIVTFASLMILVFILELSGGISGYVLRNEAVEVIEQKMRDTMPKYINNNATEILKIWDELQEDFHCCGTKEPKDWIEYFGNNSLPMSCCSKIHGAFGSVSCTLNSTNHYPDGCLSKFGAFIKSHAVQIGGVGFGIAFVQAIGVWFAIYLARAIKTSYETV